MVICDICNTPFVLITGFGERAAQVAVRVTAGPHRGSQLTARERKGEALIGRGFTL